MNNQRLVSTLVVFIGTLFACGVVALSISRGMYVGMALLIALPLGIFFVNKPRFLFMLVIATFFSGLRVPFLFANFNLFHLLAIAFVGIGVLDLLVRKERKLPSAVTTVWFALFLLNLLWLIYFRGAGFRFLGDNNWGGMRYVFLVLAIGLYLNGRFIRLTTAQWKWTLMASFLLGLLPFLAEAVFIASRGRITAQYIFIEFAASTFHNMGATLGGGYGVGRLQTANQAGEMLILITLGYLHISSRKRPLMVILLCCVGLMLIGLSGHRLGLVKAVGMIWLYFAIHYIRVIWRYLLLSTAACSLAVALLYFSAPSLPLTAQRMVSFLPGIHIDPIAEISASSTTQWRLNVWRHALTEIPDYLLLGKGYTFPAFVRENLVISGQAESVRLWAIETVAYHNGILSLLIGMGVTGLLIGSALLFTLLARYTHILFGTWSDEGLHNLFRVLYVLLAVNVGTFFTIYGDVFVTFPRIFFLAFVLEGMMQTLKRKKMIALNPISDDADHEEAP